MGTRGKGRGREWRVGDEKDGKGREREWEVRNEGVGRINSVARWG